MKWLRSLYDWVLSWAYTPYGTAALAVLAFTESSVFPIPPDVLLIALCISRREYWAYYASVSSLFSVLGGLAGYAIGWGLWQIVDQFFFTYVPGFTPETFAKVQGLYERFDFWIVFVAAFTPIPFKVITVTAGVFGVSLPMFILASTVGRSARFFIVGYLIHHFGAPIRDFIERRFNLVTIAFAVFLIAGFAALKALGH
jgi:membrane protein YqaA with SNARE-associated domain